MSLRRPNLSTTKGSSAPRRKRRRRRRRRRRSTTSQKPLPLHYNNQLVTAV